MKSLIMTKRRVQTPPEEAANSAVHGLAFIALVAAYPTLRAAAVRSGQPHLPAGVSLFVGTLAFLYFSSAIYHAVPRGSHPQAKRVFQRLDQSAIFLSIAGTYTPFAIGSLRTAWDWVIFAAIWGLAVFGIGFRIFQGFRGTHLMTILYLSMGSLALVALAPVLARMPPHGLLWLLGGLAAYAVGILFFMAHHVRFRHVAWHLCAVFGSTCNFLAVLWYACGATGSA